MQERRQQIANRFVTTCPAQVLFPQFGDQTLAVEALVHSPAFFTNLVRIRAGRDTATVDALLHAPATFLVRSRMRPAGSFYDRLSGPRHEPRAMRWQWTLCRVARAEALWLRRKDGRNSVATQLFPTSWLKYKNKQKRFSIRSDPSRPGLLDPSPDLLPDPLPDLPGTSPGPSWTSSRTFPDLLLGPLPDILPDVLPDPLPQEYTSPVLMVTLNRRFLRNASKGIEKPSQDS
jgi:hypothetical protein